MPSGSSHHDMALQMQRPDGSVPQILLFSNLRDVGMVARLSKRWNDAVSQSSSWCAEFHKRSRGVEAFVKHWLPNRKWKYIFTEELIPKLVEEELKPVEARNWLKKISVADARDSPAIAQNARIVMVVDVFFKDTLMLSAVHSFFDRADGKCYSITDPDFGASELPNTWRNDSEMLKCKIRMIAVEEADTQQPKCTVTSLLCGECSIDEDGNTIEFQFVDQRRGKIFVHLNAGTPEEHNDYSETLFDTESTAVVEFGPGKRHFDFSNGFVRTLLRQLERHTEAGNPAAFDPLK